MSFAGLWHRDEEGFRAETAFLLEASHHGECCWCAVHIATSGGDFEIPIGSPLGPQGQRSQRCPLWHLSDSKDVGFSHAVLSILWPGMYSSWVVVWQQILAEGPKKEYLPKPSENAYKVKEASLKHQTTGLKAMSRFDCFSISLMPQIQIPC